MATFYLAVSVTDSTGSQEILYPCQGAQGSGNVMCRSTVMASYGDDISVTFSGSEAFRLNMSDGNVAYCNIRASESCRFTLGDDESIAAAAAQSAEADAAPRFLATLGRVEYEITRVQQSPSGGVLIAFEALESGTELLTGPHETTSLTDSSGVEHRQTSRFMGTSQCRPTAEYCAMPLRRGSATQFAVGFGSVPPLEVIPYLQIPMKDQGTLEFRDIPVPYEAPM